MDIEEIETGVRAMERISKNLEKLREGQEPDNWGAAITYELCATVVEQGMPFMELMQYMMVTMQAMEMRRAAGLDVREA